jgi:hypothetical protein
MSTTNLVFSEWNQIFKNPMTTLAAIDRVLHHAVILDMMEVESYRAKEASHAHLREIENEQEVSKASSTENESATVIRSTGKNY